MCEKKTEETKELFRILGAYHPSATIKEMNKCFAKIKKLFRRKNV